MNRKAQHNSAIDRSRHPASRDIRASLHVAACTFEVRVDDGAIQLFPAGEFDALHGAMLGKGPWHTSADIATRVIARVAARRNDLVIDYEHQTLKSDDNGQPAPAAGWVSPVSLEWREGEGLFARSPDWTDKAAAHIAAKEYRYISPVFIYDPESGEVIDLLHIALTNAPAIDGMQTVGERAAATFGLFNQPQEENPMNEELLRLLGLDPDANEEQAVAAVTALLQQVTDGETAIAAARAETPNTALEAIQGLQSEVAALTAKINDNEVSDLVDIAMSEGRLVPAQEQWARDLGKHDIASLKGYLASAQPFAALTGSQTEGKQSLDEDGKPVLSETQLAVCSQMGVDPDEYKKTLEAH
ncbi:MAG: phage protease [Candidatus Sedimenticola sp. 6PFRAG7]